MVPGTVRSNDSIQENVVDTGSGCGDAGTSIDR